MSTNHNPFDTRIYYKEATSLKKKGYDVSVLGHTDEKTINEVDGIKIIGNNKSVDPKQYLQLLCELLNEATSINADVYHIHEPESLPAAIYLKLLKGKKVIYDVHEYYVDKLPDMSLQRKVFFMFLLYFIEPLFCHYFDAIITADEGIADRYKKFNENVHPIINLPPLQVFEGDTDPFIEEKYKDNDIIIYVGGLAEERGIFNLIEAINKISIKYNTIKLLLLGNFETNQFKNKCFEYIKKNKLEKNIEYLGFLPHTEIPKYIKISKIGTVLLHPTERFKKTAYPLKLFEYMACGKPVLASDLPAMGKIVKETKCGLLTDPKNMEKISDSIIYLLENPQKAEEMGMNGKKAVETKYNWEVMEQNLLKIYGCL
ncbi:glycosyltransferase family 4 protein [Methanosarcina sp. KYL-1]|uniref:glycosyltransferase family 4 protein n=1 Tax=Methanosarcina sp. KYL-1 TaxID=2602068 RepID=UPI002100835C|nr:glycosyltransferase family 4 protein [Methanosarcina sp. KYL-1]